MLPENKPRSSTWTGPKSLFESALSRTYANSAVSALSLERALACRTGCPLLARSLWARFRQPQRQGFLGQAIEIPHSNRLLADMAEQEHEAGHECGRGCEADQGLEKEGHRRPPLSKGVLDRTATVAPA